MIRLLAFAIFSMFLSSCGASDVVARATAQGGTGDPNIGLIPTMQNLTAED